MVIMFGIQSLEMLELDFQFYLFTHFHSHKSNYMRLCNLRSAFIWVTLNDFISFKVCK